MSGSLAIGPSADTTPANRIFLDDWTATAGNLAFPAMPQSFGQRQFKGGMDWGTYERDPMGKGGQAAGTFRTLTFGLLIGGASRPAIQVNLHKLQRVLQQARDSSRFGALGAPVVLIWQPDPTAVETYIDVIGGRIDLYDKAGAPSSRALFQGALMTLYVRPFYRQAQSANNPTVTIATSSTITDCVATYRIADTGGDADGLLRLTITDQSIGSKIINRVRIGRRSLAPLGASDFTPLLVPTPAVLGSAVSDATARGGTTPQLSLAFGSAAWFPFAQASQPGSGLAQGGEVAVWARCRDHSPVLDASTAAPFTGAGAALTAGTLPMDEYLLRLATVDSNGNESVACAPFPTGANNRSTAGVFDSFASGTLTTTYTAEQLVQTGYNGGSNTASPDASFDGVYGYRSFSLTPRKSLATWFVPSVNRLHYATDDMASGSTGTRTVYGKFRVNEVSSDDPVARSFIGLIYSDGNSFATNAVYTGAPGAVYGVMVGFEYIGGNVWQTISPSNQAVYVTLIPGQWYTFSTTLVVTTNSTAGLIGTVTFCLNGQALLSALAFTASLTVASVATAFATLKPGVGTVLALFWVPAGGTVAIAANDIVEVDFDDVGVSTSATLMELVPTWTAVTGTSSYNLYVASTAAPTAWYQIQLGNVLTATINAPFAVPPGVLPQSRMTGTSATALLRATVRPPNSADVTPTPSQGGQPRYGQSVWEWVNLGTLLLPALPWQDGATQPPGWKIQIEANFGGVNALLIDCDTIFVIPVDEDQAVLEVPGAALPSLGVWTVDFNRSERQGCAIVPAAGGTTVAYASVTGRISGGQGDTELCFMFEVADAQGRFVADIVNSRLTIGATVSPRYESV